MMQMVVLETVMQLDAERRELPMLHQAPFVSLAKCGLPFSGDADKGGRYMGGILHDPH